MSILIRCDCGRYFERPDADAGRFVFCPACGVGLTVPGPSSRREPEFAPGARPDPEAWPDVLIIPEAPATSRVSVKAVLSLVLGSLFFFACFTGLPAIIIGCAALADVSRSGGRLRGGRMAIIGVGLGLFGCLWAFITPINWGTREAARRSQCVNNLKQIGLAFHNYHAEFGCFPPAAIVGKDGRPLLSWRVALLPYLERAELYAKFHLDEPWDSANNGPLLLEMPSVFACPSDPDRQRWMTNYQVVVGPKTAFPPDFTPMTFEDFRDGTSNTILVGETRNLALWSSPEDLRATQGDWSGLGSHHPGGFNALFADGHVPFFKARPEDRATFDRFLTPSGGEPIDRESP